MRHLAILLLCCFALPASAGRDDHDRARRAMQAGEILPLSRILDVVAATRPGRVIEVDLERDHGRWIYDLEVITPEGRLYEMEIDAATGAVLEIEHDRDHD